MPADEEMYRKRLASIERHASLAPSLAARHRRQMHFPI
jgi:hypothetical protein